MSFGYKSLGFGSGGGGKVYSIEFLVVAGGGAGPQPGGGRSAGAGGYRNASIDVETGEVITVTVGSGAGPRGGAGRYGGGPGGSSHVVGDKILDSYASSGGGGGGGLSSESSGKQGGSGGGGSPPGTGNLGGYTPVEGYDGSPGAGGGSSQEGSQGGAGTQNDIIEAGTNVTYAAGGSPVGGNVGNGGPNGSGGDGGTVVLRMLTADYSGVETGSPTKTTDGDYQVLHYTSTGSYTA